MSYEDNTSLGAGIGLQGQPKMYENIWAKTMRDSTNRKDADRRAAAKKKAEDDAAFKAITDKDFKVDASKYHPLYMDKVNQTLQGTFNDILQIKRDNPDTWMNIAPKKIMDMNAKLNFYQQNSAIANQYEKDILDGKTYADPDFAKSLHDPLAQKDWSKVKTDDQGIYGTTFDPVSGAINYNPVGKFDMQKLINDVKSKPANWSDTGSTTSKVPGNDPYRNQVTERKAIKPEVLQQVIGDVTSDTHAIGDYVARHKDEYKDAVKSGIIKDPSSRATWIHDGLAKEVTDGIGGESSTISTYNRKVVTPKADKKADKIVDLTPSNGRKWNTTYASVGSDSKGAAVKSYVAGVTSDKAYTIPSPVSIDYAPEQHLNVGTGRAEYPAGTVSYKISAIERVPYTVDKNGDILAISEETKKKYPKGYKTGWFATGIEDAGMVQGDKNLKPRALPLTKSLYDLVKTKGKLNLKDFNESELFDAEGVSQPEEKKSAAPVEKAKSLRDKYGY